MAKIRSVKGNKSVFGGHQTIRVAAIQAPHIVYNKEKSIEVACKRIKEAGENGAKLVAFSETYIPAYPAYYTGGFSSKTDEWALWNVALQDHSITIPSEDTEIIGRACRDAGVYCVMGVNELDDTDGSRTLYDTQILFGPDGSILGRHRKLMPTYTERTYWGWGDGSDLKVYQTGIGRIGSLICWEHHTILVRAAQMLMGEEFHIANWPGTWTIGQKKENGERIAQVFTGVTKTGDHCDWQFAAREYAFESGCFVISVSGLLREQDFEPEFKHFIDSPHMNFGWAVGGAAIINPFGEYIAGPVYNDDTIVYADCHANEIKAAKVMFDGLGHYSRPDVVQLLLRDDERRNLLRSSRAQLSYQDLKNISESTEVSIEKLEKVIEKIESTFIKNGLQ